MLEVMRESLQLNIAEHGGPDPVVVIHLPRPGDPQEHRVPVHGHDLTGHLILYVDVWCPNIPSKPVLPLQHKVSVRNYVRVLQSLIMPSLPYQKMNIKCHSL